MAVGASVAVASGDAVWVAVARPVAVGLGVGAALVAVDRAVAVVLLPMVAVAATVGTTAVAALVAVSPVEAAF